MPKTPKKPYSKTSLAAAIEECQANDGVRSVRSIAAKYGVPRSSLIFKLNNPGRENFGPNSVLTSDEESLLTQWLLDLAKKGFPRKKEDIFLSVQQLIVKTPRPNPFKDNKPAEGWLRSFIKRNPIINERTSDVTRDNACVSEKDIRDWFRNIGDYFKENELEDTLLDPSRIFISNQTKYQLWRSKEKESFQQRLSNESITVLFTFSAKGQTNCPMIIYPYKRIPVKVLKSIPSSWGVGKSKSGCMTAEFFYEYIANVFYPNLLRNKTVFPVILFVDGNKSIVTYNLSLLCAKLKIELIGLYPNSNRILQCTNFGWKKCVSEWQANNPFQAVKKFNFGQIIKNVNQWVKPDILINGFLYSGLYPFNLNALNFSKCLDTNLTQSNVKKYPLKYSKFADIVGKNTLDQFENIDPNLGDEQQNIYFSMLYRLWTEFHTYLPCDNVIEQLDADTDNSENPIISSDDGSMSYDSPFDFEESESENYSLNFCDKFKKYFYEKNKTENKLVKKTSPKETKKVKHIKKDKKAKSVRKKSHKKIVWKTAIKPVKKVNGYKIKKKKRYKRLKNNSLKTAKIKELACDTVLNNIETKSSNNIISKYESNILKSTSENYIESKEKVIIECITILSDSDILKCSIPLKSTTHSKETPTKLTDTLKAKENVCCICFMGMRRKKLLTCGSCKMNFHVKCVPQYHSNSIPENMDIDLFTCHQCFITVNTIYPFAHMDNEDSISESSSEV